MLPLDDPLWRKLDDAYRDRNIPDLLAKLSNEWDSEAADALFWGNLCHQDTCYGATYAVVPHLLSMAEPAANVLQRREIAHFLGHVVLCALRNPFGGLEGMARQELPPTLLDWDAKLEPYRYLVRSMENPERPLSDYEKTQLPHYREVLSVEAVTAADLEKIALIRADFLSAIPAIRAVCERALFEQLDDKGDVLHLLAGVAATHGFLDLAWLLDGGAEGYFCCASCGWQYEYALSGDRVAVFVDDPLPLSSRAAGFMTPIADGQILDASITALLSLAGKASSPEPVVLLRNFLGAFRCCKCGVEGSVRAS